MSVLQLRYCAIGLQMDKDIKSLEKIGLHEVCKKTHIEVKQLQYMINNEYEKLNKINTLGFVKILSREYKLDLSGWLEGFYTYWEEHKNDEELRKDKIFIRARKDRSSRKLLWLFLLVILGSGVWMGLSFFKIEFNIPALIEMINPSIEKNATGFQDAPIIKEAATSMGVKVEERVVESNSTNATKEVIAVVVEANQSAVAESNVSVEKNATLDVPLVQDLPQHKAMIMPTRKMWIGIIDLENGSRTESTGDKKLSLDLTKRQLIKTGHGYFKLSYDGSVEDFTEQGSTRFFVENGTVKKISEEMFVQINQGKTW